MSNIELESALKEYRQLQRMQEEVAAELEAIKCRVRDAMMNMGVDTLAAGEYKVSDKTITSTRLDTTALKAALPEVATAFTRAITSRRFCVV